MRKMVICTDARNYYVKIGKTEADLCVPSRKIGKSFRLREIKEACHGMTVLLTT